MDKKLKAGIITFNQALNYGAVIQAFALKEVLENYGYETYIINYNYPGINVEIAPLKKFRKSSNIINGLIGLMRSLTSYNGDKKREKNFIAFREKYLNESKKCYSKEDIAALNYDIYISGSDQIWNYKITGGSFDPTFFLDFETDAIKIIYAASSQDTPFPLNMENQLKEQLMSSKAIISIREKKLSEYVMDITGLGYPTVLDPTLLAGREVYEDVDFSIRPTKDEYILLYQIDRNPYTDITVKSLERKFGCKVYSMSAPKLGKSYGRKGTVGPDEFLSYLVNAKFLVTNSFHGIALSIVFNKQFFVYENGGVMSRINNLLDNFNLTDRKVKNTKDINPDKMTDYIDVNVLLEKYRANSVAFLETALKGRQIFSELDSASKYELPIMSEREKKDCCGCSACEQICPVGAINMKRDDEGFLYPVIDSEKCINCQFCTKVCGFHKIKPDKVFGKPHAYGIKHKDIDTRVTSRSGGAFVGLSDIILGWGGAVYGAVMQDDFSVKHIRATTHSERDLMKNAKYVQSYTSEVYYGVENDLKNGMYVLFSGTPCQVSGLKDYIKTKNIPSDKLYCCDMVCHGVPSPQIWNDYVRYIENKKGTKIKEANFRDKSFGWDSHFESFILLNDKKIISNNYTKLFYQHGIFRPSCYNCKFANTNRVGDITYADFWGIEKHDRSFDDDLGVSLVLINSEKGINLFEKAKRSFDYFSCDVENCMQPTLYKPTDPSPFRDEFWRDYHIYDFDKLIKKYTYPKGIMKKSKKVVNLVLYKFGMRKHP